jgi:hypothetical protein
VFDSGQNEWAEHPRTKISCLIFWAHLRARLTGCKNNLSPGSRPTLPSFVFSEPGSLRARASQREDSATAAHPHSRACRRRRRRPLALLQLLKIETDSRLWPSGDPSIGADIPSAVLSPTTVPLRSAGVRDDRWLRRRPDRRPGERACG